MAESRVIVEELLALCLQRITVEENSMRTEQELIELVKNFEEVRKKWLHAELELKKYKELLVKSDVAKAALEVKLKHARNQLDVEMKKRYKVEADYQYLVRQDLEVGGGNHGWLTGLFIMSCSACVGSSQTSVLCFQQRQMQLMCDILVHDTKSSACLNDEQKSLLATFEHKGGNMTLQRSTRRLPVIDESSFLSHSDISYDRTDDDVDLDTTVIQPLRSRARERRRSSMGLPVGAPVRKRSRGRNLSAELLERKTVEKEVETIVKASIISNDTGGQVHMVLGITQETSDTQECTVSAGGQTSVWFPCNDSVTGPEGEALVEEKVRNIGRDQKASKHTFVSKTVIRPETCTPCGKRIRFGKMVVKCRNCRVVAHPECRQKFADGCTAFNATAGSTTQTAAKDSLEDFAPQTHPRVPQLIVDCVAEIERRGLQERGLYRVPGGERLVKELRDCFLQGKSALMLSKVQDVHVVCGLLKDFLRKLNEPMITFRLHRTFMEASELPDEDNCSATMYQAIAELPKANRDTLAFLMIHLHKVMRSPQCQMDQNNLARVFGPTIVGHGMPEPSPSTILRDTNTQLKVVCCLLSLPEDCWRRILIGQIPPPSSTSKMGQNEGQGCFFQPLTSPELNSYYQATAGGSVRGRVRNRANAGRPEPARKFFTSPS
ncbi:rac GTPase-activating protein 1 isoform X3 [Oreochromis niloticus]|uniref:rac GTPase-activating protein 1 isoform X3 n=1 Tax=Oreochromis niloticus TaxID=8128 RepID=UPI000DF327BC|nr:rac GTPase-activating protein 1 isoform X3 [Oreochromis niloticus]